MVDKYTKEKTYDYDVNANQVVNNEKYFRHLDNEPTGEAETLVGKELHKFGDLAQREKPPIKLKEKSKKQTKKTNPKPLNNQIISDVETKEKYTSLITSSNTNEKLLYNPKTKETYSIYEELLTFTQKFLPDQPTIFIKSAVDVIIAAIKTENRKEEDKMKDIETILGPIKSDDFNKMVQIVKGLVDFEAKEGNETNVDESEIEMNVEFDELGELNNDAHYLSDDDEMSIENEVQNEQQSEKMDEEVDENDINKNEIKGIENEEEDAEINYDNELNENSLIQNHFFLQNYLREKLMIDDSSVLKVESEIIEILKIEDNSVCEKKLLLMLKRENFDFVSFLINNKTLIYYITKLNQCQNDDDKENVIKELCSTTKGEELFQKIINSANRQKKKTSNLLHQSTNILNVSNNLNQDPNKFKHVLNLENLELNPHFNSNTKLLLPKGTTKEKKEGYEEIIIPPQILDKTNNSFKEVYINTLPGWMHRAYQYLNENNKLVFINDKFNIIQSSVLSTALNTDENLLICAPTSSGKTNIAMMTILRLISKNRDEKTNKIFLNNFKIVYIAPMKALVKETVGNFSQRLKDYNIEVKELSGDINLSKHELESTNVIVTTPEKWDIITRKSGERTFTEKVQLIIVDEIHLLHDSRGAVIESIVARTIKNSISNKDPVRLVALSATLPNYKDVAEFCHVSPKKGLFYFNNSYRPIPLEQRFIGITEKKGIKRLILINEICYNKVIERTVNNKQILIFVHSRRETLRTARNLIDIAKNRSEVKKFAISETKQREFNAILDSDLENNLLKDKSLVDLFKYGIGVHHAGMNRNDRELVEEYFNNGYLNVVVCTATLAWGVNLPAHTVIIKGTQIYDPEKGNWTELSHLDVMQMMGRAGRVGYSSNIGEGIIITNYTELQFYLSLLNQQLPIESQLMKFLPDTLNAEIVSGNVSNIEEAVDWLSYTYLYIRMKKAPNVYGITYDEYNKDKALTQRRIDLIHSCAVLLNSQGLIKYDNRTDEFLSTQLGKVASYYYIKYQSIGTYNKNLNPNMNIIDLFKLFSMSYEFKLIPIREEEKKEVEKFLMKVPIPVKGSLNEPTSKINILLQAYISNSSLENYAISTDMIYVSQNAARIFTALLEICIKRGWANMSQICLNIVKMIKLRMWNTLTPLRQFGIIPKDIIHKIESREQLTWERLYELSSTQISEVVKINKKNSEGIYKLIHTFPRIELSANIQPLTRNCLLVELIITPNFKWNSNYHKHSELFHIFVEDNDSEIILHHETFSIKEKDMPTESENSTNDKRIIFVVPMIEPMPPQYFIRVVSENWLNCEKVLALYFRNIILPEKFPPFTNLLDLHPLSYKELCTDQDILEYYTSNFKQMNSVQTQCFKNIFESNNSIFIGATAGNGKTQLAEFAMIKHFNENKGTILKAPIIYLEPYDDCIEEKYEIFSKIFKTKKINIFTGQYTLDSNIFDKSDIVLSTFINMDYFTRKFRKKKNLNELALVIVDDAHLIGENNSCLEMALTRLRYTSSALKNNKLRFIIISTSLSNPNSICDWLNIDIEKNCFNFNPNVRQNKIELFFYGYENSSHQSRLNLMTKPIIQTINKHSYLKGFKLSTIIYVTDLKCIKNFILDLLSYNAALKSELKDRYLITNTNDYENILESNLNSKDKVLISGLLKGMGYIDESLSNNDIKFILNLFKNRVIQILVVSYKMIWKISVQTHISIIADPVKYDSNLECYTDYNISDMYQIMGSCSINYDETKYQDKDKISIIKNNPRKCFIFFQNCKKEFYKKFLLESFPLESQLNNYLHDNMLIEICNGIIKTKQTCIDWITWTYLYYRLLQNPNYYDMKEQTNESLNDFLSELIEQTLNNLSASNCIQINESTSEIIPTNLGKISSFYNIMYNTIDLFNQNVNQNTTKLSEMLHILKSAYEFDYIEFNKKDVITLSDLAQDLPGSYLGKEIKEALQCPEKQESSFVLSNPHNKSLIILLCYLSRKPLPINLLKKAHEIILIFSRLILGVVDVLSSKQYLKPALLAMQLSQMIVQGMWITQSPLYQLPYLDHSTVNKLIENKIEDIPDFMNMEEDNRNSIVKVSTEQMEEIAYVCNRYPNINMEISMNKKIKVGESININVELIRDVDDEEELSPVFSRYYPIDKEENWWVAVGNESNNKLVCIKRINFFRKIKFNLNFSSPDNIGKYSYKIYLFSDSWIGCDQDDKIEFEIIQ